MIDIKLYAVLNKISSEHYITAKKIANTLDLGEKTVRLRIQDLNIVLRSNGAEIMSKAHYGYKLKIFNEDLYNNFLKNLNTNISDTIPTLPEERVDFILHKLLYTSQYMKLENISDTLFISRNTVSSDIKKVERILNSFNLSLERRPNHGIFVVGKEKNKRQCILNIFYNNSMFNDDESIKESIKSLLIRYIYINQFRISEVSCKSLVKEIYVMVDRIKNGYFIQSNDFNKTKLETIREEIWELANDIANSLNGEILVSISPNEISYLAIHLAGKITPNYYEKDDNVIITKEIDELAIKMINTVYSILNLDFRSNLDLRMSLCFHLLPLDIRLKYDISLENPILKKVQKELPFAYTVAATSSIVLKDYYEKSITEDEIGYLALLFELAMKKRDKFINKKNILIICMTGRGSSKLFLHQFREAFGEYINKIYECSIYEISNFDFISNNIDYIFSTVPINQQVPVPIFIISNFFGMDDIVRLKELFNMGNYKFLEKYFRKELFVTNINSMDKKQVIKDLCKHASKYYDLPNNFYELVIKREELGQTDFGNFIAIPHPIKLITKHTFVTVGILDTPIWWGNNEVEIVLLFSISYEDDNELEKFYKVISSLIFNIEAINKLKNDKDFDTLISVLHTCIEAK
ncbi:MAG: BglG family transcription antiterminator [Eubacteriales bacterium]